MTLEIIKQYLNIAPSNTTQDALLELFMNASQEQASRITDEANALIDLAILKDIATNYQHRENYLDAENGGLILSQTTINILNQYRKTIIY
ncbi:MAG: phage gp6-like head-tail connector protein [Pedobacter sp.]|nr:MAG: phage gp6-like head-tail connector protein [Pedobacter sp.]